MKIIALILSVTSCVFFASCATNKSSGVTENTPYLNQEELTGLVSLGENLSSLHLNYALDSPAGEELHLYSCIAVNNTLETNVETSQYHLLQLMKANCIAAGYYFEALKIGKVPSFLPDTLNASFIKSLPAQAIPNLGGQSLENRNGTLVESEKNLQVLSLDERVVELSLADNMVVKYLIMSRGDFNHDGIEDLLLRLDWYISSAFGKGFDLLMVTQTSENAKPSLVWRR
jgi:hypothetical protein